MSRAYNTLHEEEDTIIEEGRTDPKVHPTWLDSTSSIESPIEINQHASLASSNDGFQPFSYKVKPPDKRFLWIWPKSWDDALWTFDGTLIRLTQKIDGKIAKYISLLFTGMVALELIIAAPFALLMIGYDSLSIQIGYLALVLATLSQIPKRFVWRYRPYMIYRAQERKRDKTSSFPSRGVTSAVVFSYIVVVVTEHFTDMSIEWWTVLLTVGLTALVAYARVSVGSILLFGKSDLTLKQYLGSIRRTLSVGLCWWRTYGNRYVHSRLVVVSTR
jgi:membrane-associated phospholipid phosphatase